MPSFDKNAEARYAQANTQNFRGSIAYDYSAKAATGAVAGATYQASGESTSWSKSMNLTISSLGEFYGENVSKPFTRAVNQILDIHEPVQNLWEFCQPGVDAVLNAWYQLLAEPY